MFGNLILESTLNIIFLKLGLSNYRIDSYGLVAFPRRIEERHEIEATFETCSINTTSKQKNLYLSLHDYFCICL